MKTKKKVWIIVIFFLCAIVLAGVFQYQKNRPQTYTENATLKLKERPGARMIGGKAFVWFAEIDESNHPYYTISIYSEAGLRYDTYRFRLSPADSPAIDVNDLSLFSNDEIILVDKRKLLIP
ncbi:MAG: hypothetical protein V7731_17835 [Amphritea sp.]